MPRNSTGVYSLPLPPVIAGEIIEAAWANSTMNDIGQALTDSLDRNGRGGMLAPFFFTDGTVSNPGAAWSNAPGTGLYRTTSFLGFSWNGALIHSYGANGIAMNAGKEVYVSTPPSVGDALTNKTYVDALVAAVPIGNYLPKAGGVMTGDIVFSENSEGITLSNGSRFYDSSTTLVWNGGPTTASQQWYFNGTLRMTLSQAGNLNVPVSISSPAIDCTNFTAASAINANSVTANGIASNGNITAAGTVNAGGASYAANWFRVTTGATGLYSDVNGVGVQLNAGRVDIYNSTYLGAPTILATGAVYSYYSDDRLKTRTMPIGGACARLGRLDAFLYRRNELAQTFGYADDGEYMGLSAQQVQREFPQAVGRAPFDVGEHGVSKSGKDYLTIQYENLVPALVAAVKELTARLDLIEHPVLLDE